MKELFILRHGETAWSKSGQHTGSTDIELTENGVKQTEALANRLKRQTFDHIFTSPLIRAKKTCEVCGFLNRAKVMDELKEWDYGLYEGLRTDEILQNDPTWHLFKDGAPQGDSLESIGKRADAILAKVTQLEGRIALFTSGHISRVIGARYLGLKAEMGRLFYLSTASISRLGTEHEIPVILTWNDTAHLDNI